MHGDVILFAAVATPAVPVSAGSSLWQLLFLSFGCILILFEILRGWRRGIARQLARLGGLIAAYFVGYFGGDLIGPWVRPFFRLPNAVLSMVAGAVLALLVYAVISGLGTMLFKRTSQHDSMAVRLFYGVSGAVLGLFFGGFLIWLVVVAVRSLGAVADAQVRQQPATTAAAPVPERSLHAVDLRNRSINDSTESTTLLASLARMKN